MAVQQAPLPGRTAAGACGTAALALLQTRRALELLLLQALRPRAAAGACGAAALALLQARRALELLLLQALRPRAVH